jgi:hypothetical protein
MWFKRKPRNRRLGREHVLDVKLRTSKVRAARWRLTALIAVCVFGIAFSIFVVWRAGEWGLNRLVYENQAFALRDFDIQTDGVIAQEQLRRWTEVKLGQNLLALDLARVKRNLELVPMIETASIERILPHTLRIRVTERLPLAQINLPQPRVGGGVEMASYQIDSAGYVISPLEARQRAEPASPPEEMPVLAGISSGDVQPGRRVERQQVQAALQLLVAFDHSPMAGLVDIKRLDVSAPEVLTVTTTQGSEVIFGLKDLDRQLLRWHAIFESGQRLGKAIASLDLAMANNIPARWLEASELPAVPLRPPKPLHNKKKNV